MDELQQWDIVQVSPESDVRDEFKGKIAIVDEPRTWGCIAYVHTFEGRAFIRLRSDQFQKVGTLAWVPQDSSS